MRQPKDHDMHLLIMGGTRFVGRHTVDAAIDAGHRVTLFNRGITGQAPSGTTLVQGDRNDPADLARLVDAGPFDAVIDCCAYYPQQVHGLIDALADGGRLVGPRYVFVSTISVYGEDPLAPGATEDSPTVAAVYPDTLPDSPLEHYGGLKVACEEVARDRVDRLTIVRPGLIIGPRDHTGRFTYWVTRLHEGGRVLAPGGPDRLVQAIDARDLGSWLVALSADGPDTTLHGIMPPQPFGSVLQAIGTAVGTDCELVWVDDEPLLAAGVEEWSDLPLWLAPANAGILQLSADRALAAGLRPQPIAQTAADTLAWVTSITDAGQSAGIDRAREAELLAGLAS